MKHSGSVIICALSIGFASAEYSNIDDIYRGDNYLFGSKPEYPTNTISPAEAANPDTNCKNWLKDSICTEWQSDVGSGGKVCDDSFGLNKCRKTCGLCHTTCEDHPLCRRETQASKNFASAVRCIHFAWVYNCPESCNRCAPNNENHHDALGAVPTGALAATPATNCKNWNDDVWCQANAVGCTDKKNVRLQCKQTCGLCAAPDCVDDAKCAGWKITAGKCFALKSKALLRSCPRSCGWCDGMNTNFDMTSTDLNGNEIVEVADPGRT